MFIKTMKQETEYLDMCNICIRKSYASFDLDR